MSARSAPMSDQPRQAPTRSSRQSVSQIRLEFEQRQAQQRVRRAPQVGRKSISSAATTNPPPPPPTEDVPVPKPEGSVRDRYRAALQTLEANQPQADCPSPNRAGKQYSGVVMAAALASGHRPRPVGEEASSLSSTSTSSAAARRASRRSVGPNVAPARPAVDKRMSRQSVGARATPSSAITFANKPNPPAPRALSRRSTTLGLAPPPPPPPPPHDDEDEEELGRHTTATTSNPAPPPLHKRSQSHLGATSAPTDDGSSIFEKYARMLDLFPDSDGQQQQQLQQQQQPHQHQLRVNMASPTSDRTSTASTLSPRLSLASSESSDQSLPNPIKTTTHASQPANPLGSYAAFKEQQSSVGVLDFVTLNLPPPPTPEPLVALNQNAALALRQYKLDKFERSKLRPPHQRSVVMKIITLGLCED